MERSHRETKDLQWFGYKDSFLALLHSPSHLLESFSSLCQQAPLWRRKPYTTLLTPLTTQSQMSSSNPSQNQSSQHTTIQHDLAHHNLARLEHTTPQYDLSTPHLSTPSSRLVHTTTSHLRGFTTSSSSQQYFFSSSQHYLYLTTSIHYFYSQI